MINVTALSRTSRNGLRRPAVDDPVFGRKRRLKATHVTELEHVDQLASDGKPVLIDLFQTNCAPCRVMDGIVDELADEYRDGAHVVKINVVNVPEAIDAFKVRSTPTFAVVSAKVRSDGSRSKASLRWRASGLIKKNELAKVLDRNGGVRAES